MPLARVKTLSKTALLCIDDDQDVLECEKAFLEAFGYTVVTASSGREGLELVGLRSFDVVIVDYSMPEMNGREFAIAMKQLRPRAPIIMLSGMVDIPGQALKVVDAFVPKDRLAGRLVPAIELLCGAESLPSSSNDAYSGNSVHSKRPIRGAIGT
jgi:CheY-like chemotaxis protein